MEGEENARTQAATATDVRSEGETAATDPMATSEQLQDVRLWGRISAWFSKLDSAKL